MNQIQEKLRLLQKISSKTQAQLAGDLNVTTLSFSNWWTGKSFPRKDAILRIDTLLRNYGLASGDDRNINSIKKNAAHNLFLKHKDILKYLNKRPDLVDELSLQITYNSNAIEGSTLTVADTASIIFENINIKNKTVTEQLEAINHDKAFRFLIERLQGNVKIDSELAKSLHKILMAGIREDAGEYRKNPVRIVGSFVPTANYIRVPELMTELFKKKSTKDIIMSASRFHADFERIHPFSDGNGRVGRLILIAMLLQNNFAPAVITRKKRPEYYKALQLAQLKDNYEQIEDFVCDAVIEGYRIINS